MRGAGANRSLFDQTFCCQPKFELVNPSKTSDHLPPFTFHLSPFTFHLSPFTFHFPPSPPTSLRTPETSLAFAAAKPPRAQLSSADRWPAAGWCRPPGPVPDAVEAVHRRALVAASRQFDTDPS